MGAEFPANVPRPASAEPLKSQILKSLKNRNSPTGTPRHRCSTPRTEGSMLQGSPNPEVHRHAFGGWGGMSCCSVGYSPLHSRHCSRHPQIHVLAVPILFSMQPGRRIGDLDFDSTVSSQPPLCSSRHGSRCPLLPSCRRGLQGAGSGCFPTASWAAIAKLWHSKPINHPLLFSNQETASRTLMLKSKKYDCQLFFFPPGLNIHIFQQICGTASSFSLLGPGGVEEEEEKERRGGVKEKLRFS